MKAILRRMRELKNKHRGNKSVFFLVFLLQMHASVEYILKFVNIFWK